jgi:cytidine deaminase
VTNDELIREAEKVLNRHVAPGERMFGDVGAALISDRGNVYRGVCVDTTSWGLCAERSAVAAMITNGEYKIRRIVGVWRNEKDGKLYVLSPCGICREFIRSIDHSNLDTEVVLGRNEVVKLGELLPRHEWPQPLT